MIHEPEPRYPFSATVVDGSLTYIIRVELWPAMPFKDNHVVGLRVMAGEHVHQPVLGVRRSASHERRVVQEPDTGKRTGAIAVVILAGRVDGSQAAQAPTSCLSCPSQKESPVLLPGSLSKAACTAVPEASCV